MTSENYQALALVMRFVFCLLGMAILGYALHTYFKDARNAKQLRRSEVETGHLGVLLSEGRKPEKLLLSREGEVGSGRECDIVVRGLARHCFYYEFMDGALILTPIHGRLRSPGKRDTGELVLGPGDCFTADGKTYKFKLVKFHAEALSPANRRARGER